MTKHSYESWLIVDIYTSPTWWVFRVLLGQLSAFWTWTARWWEDN